MLSMILMTACSAIILIQPQKHTYTVSKLLLAYASSAVYVQELRYDISANSFASFCTLHE